MSYTSQPDIMAIGDSMYQGVRSLSFAPDMVQFSPPAQVAAALGMAMTLPDLAQPLLFDLEALVRQGGVINLIGRIQAACIDNLRHWPLDAPWSQFEAFDNIAVGGATIETLTGETDASHMGELTDLIRAIQAPNLSVQRLAVIIGDLWYALNNCYTLNPRHRPEQANKAQLDQVAERQPRILLINIGSNEGLFGAAFRGSLDAQTLAGVASIPAKLVDVAERLRSLPQRVERIVFNSLIRPRFIPNLMPHPSEQLHYPSESYFERYGGRIGHIAQTILADELRAFDAKVNEVNDEARDLLASRVGNRLVFNDLFPAADQHDGKHFSDRGIDVQSGRHAIRLRNRPLEPTLLGENGGIDGGMAGLDNMHPTVPGYAVIADTVLRGLGRAAPEIDKSAAFASDTLLTNLPGWTVITQIELSLLGLFGVFRQGAEQPTT